MKLLPSELSVICFALANEGKRYAESARKEGTEPSVRLACEALASQCETLNARFSRALSVSIVEPKSA